MTIIIANLFSILAAGWLFRKYGIIQEGSEKAFNQYLYYLALPALTIVKIADTPLTGLGWKFVCANTAPLLAVMIVVWALWRAGAFDWRLARLLVIVSVLGNTAYMGFPVAAMRLGEAAIGYAAIVASIHNVCIFTAGFFIMSSIREDKSRHSGFVRLLGRNVVLWSSVAGLLISWSGLGIPELPRRVLSDIGHTTLPLSLFTIGASLYGKRVANNLPRIALVSGLKLILLPFFYIVTARLSGFSGFVPRVAFIEMIMPVAVLNFIIAKEFDFDSDLVSQCIVFSTLAFFPLLYIYDWAMKLFL